METYPDVWVVVAVRLYLLGKPQRQSRAGKPDVQHSALALSDAADFQEITCCLPENPGGSFVEHRSGRGEFHRPGCPVEKSGPEPGFQLLDMP